MRRRLAWLLLSVAVIAFTPHVLSAPLDHARRYRVGGNISAPRKAKHVEPVYPAEAKASRVEGRVFLEIVIDTDGSVVEARVVRSVDRSFDAEAERTVLRWGFEPTRLDGKPVELIMTVTVAFKPPPADAGPTAGA